MQKKKLFILTLIIIMISLLWAYATTSLAKPAPKRALVKIRISKATISTDKKQVLSIRYRLFMKAKTFFYVTKGNKVVKTLRKRTQKKGLYSLKWNGKDSGNNFVPRGKYLLKAKIKTSKRRKTVTKPVTVNSSLIFSEYFNRPDGLMASEYNNDGLDSLQKFDVTSGDLYISNDHGYTNSPVFRVVTVKSDFANFLLSANLLKKNLAIEPYEGLQLFFRYQDQYNLYVVGLRNDNLMHLKKKVAGEYYTLAQVPIESNKLNYWYNVKVKAVANHIEVFVDNQKYIDTYDSSFVSGKAGIRTDNLQAYFDNFEVFSQ